MAPLTFTCKYLFRSSNFVELVDVVFPELAQSLFSHPVFLAEEIIPLPQVPSHFNISSPSLTNTYSRFLEGQHHSQPHLVCLAYVSLITRTVGSVSSLHQLSKPLGVLITTT